MASNCKTCFTIHPHPLQPPCPDCADTDLETPAAYVVSAEWDTVPPQYTEGVDVDLSSHETFCEALAAYSQARRSIVADRFYLDGSTGNIATHQFIPASDRPPSHDIGEEIRF